MTIPPFWLKRFPRKVPLRLVLVVPFVLQLVSVVGLVGYLSYRNGQKAIKELANHLTEEVAGRVSDRLDTYLQIQQQAVQINQTAVSLGQLSIDDTDHLRHHLWQQISLTPLLTDNGIILSQGTQMAYARPNGQVWGDQAAQGKRENLPPGTPFFYETTADQLDQRTFYRINAYGQPTQQMYILDADVRQTPLYPRPLTNSTILQPTWSPIYPDPIGAGLNLAALAPILDQQGRFLGMFYANVALSELNAFLNGLQFSPSGQVFILEQTGDLVAASTLETVFLQSGANLLRLPAHQSQNPITRQVSQQIIHQMGSFQAVQSAQQFNLKVAGESQYVQIQPYQDGDGLSWLIVVVVPQTDFIAQIEANNRTTLFLCLGALALATALGWIVAAWIVQPILRLSKTSGHLALRQWPILPKSGSWIRELDILSHAFQRMVQALQTSFSQVEGALQESQEKFATIFRNNPEPILILTLAEGRILEANLSMVEFSGYEHSELIGRTVQEVGLWYPQVNLSGKRLSDALLFPFEHPRQKSRCPAKINNREIQLHLRSRDIRTVLLTAQGCSLEGQACIICLLKDISKQVQLESQRQQAEQALGESEAKFSTIFYACPEPAWIATLAEGRCVNVNNSLSQFLGYSCEEMLGKTCRELQLWDKLEDLYYFRKTLAERGHIANFETVFRTRSREARTVLISANVHWLNHQECILGTLRDISDRKRLERIVQGSEAQLSDLVNSAIAAITRIRIFADQTWEIVHVSAGCEVISGYTPTELTVNPHLWANRILPGDWEAILPVIFADTFAERTGTYEYRLRRKDGVVRWFSQTNHSRWDPEQKAWNVTAVTSDITDRKQIETQLRKTEQWLRQFSRQAPSVIYTIVQDEENNVWFEYISSACEAILEVTVDQVLANAEVFLSMVHPDDREAYHVAGLESAKTLNLFSYEWRMITPSGQLKWLQAKSQPERRSNGETVWYGVMLDISDRKLAEEKLRQSEAALAEAQRIAHVGNWELDPATQKITWSAELFRIFDCDPNQAAPDYPQFLQMLHPEDRQQMEGILQQTLVTGCIPASMEYRLVRPDGSVAWLLGQAEVLRDSQGKVAKLFGTCQDITEQKRIALELQKAKDAADVASQAKSVFLANISHELRTPLTAILGFTELLHRDACLTQEQQETLRLIQSSGDHLLSLINDVLDLSKIEAGRVTLAENCFDVIDLLRSLQNMFRQKTESKGLALVLDIAPDVPQWIVTDINKLRQVLINLLGNAIKFTHHGWVRVRVQVNWGQGDRVQGNWVQGDRVQGDQQASHSESEPNPTASCCLQVDIEDTGIGIAEDELDAIFHPFTQSLRSQMTGSGTGLGLTISRRFIRLMGGEMTVRSHLGEGSQFSLCLPVKLAQAPETVPTLVPRRVVGLAAGEPAYRVLVVDDSPVNLKIVSRLLVPIGFEVQAASGGFHALEILANWTPDLILMDMNMPDLDGYATTRQIRQTFSPSIKIIALTASVLAQEQSDALAVGCNDFLGKPFKALALYTLLAKHLGVVYQYETADSLPT